MCAEIPIHIMEKIMSQFCFSVNMNSVFIKITGNKNKHGMLDCFEFQPGLTCHFGVTCP